MRRIAILGPGLLGGSVALALRAHSDVEVRLWARRQEAVEEARALKIAPLVTTDVCDAVSGADTVLLCVPVGAMEAVVRQFLPALSPSALVTDVGSVKGRVCDVLGPILEGRAEFVGSHPMAGSERAGLGAARADLFQKAVCIVTPELGRTSASSLERATRFWEELGCRVRVLSPEAHDRICGLISHLPHLMASALVLAVEAEDPEAFAFCGSGFRDTTRVASGLPGMWAEILSSNRVAVAGSLRGLIRTLERAATLLEGERGEEGEQELYGLLASAKARRDSLVQK